MEVINVVNITDNQDGYSIVYSMLIKLFFEIKYLSE